jgi:type I restriction enzyme S subunit
VGQVFRTTCPSWPIDTVYYAEERDGLNLKYWEYFLKGLDLSRLDKSTAIPGLSRDDYNTVEVAIAPPQQQCAIVAEIEKQFSRLDEAVTNLRRVKANLKRYKAGVLKAAVEGRLVETEAELAHREGRTYETGEQLLQRILETRRSHWQGKGKYRQPAVPDTTGLPELPKGWVWATVDQLLGSLRNGLSKKPADSRPGVPILRISAVRPLFLNTMDHRYYRPKTSEPIDDYMLKIGDVLFVRYNGTRELVGACALVEFESGDLLYPDKLIRGTVIADTMILPSYLAVSANAGASRRHIDKLIKTTAGQQGIAGAQIRKMPIPLPPYEEQHRILSQVNRLLSVHDTLDNGIGDGLTKCNHARNSVLAMAFTNFGNVEWSR